jgi:hypothetical protein
MVLVKTVVMRALFLSFKSCSAKSSVTLGELLDISVSQFLLSNKDKNKNKFIRLLGNKWNTDCYWKVFNVSGKKSTF